MTLEDCISLSEKQLVGCLILQEVKGQASSEMSSALSPQMQVSFLSVLTYVRLIGFLRLLQSVCSDLKGCNQHLYP